MSERLNQEVWALDRCSGCGMCVATCAKGMLSWDEEEHPSLEVREKALGLSRVKLDSCSFCPRRARKAALNWKSGAPWSQRRWFRFGQRGLSSLRSLMR